MKWVVSSSVFMLSTFKLEPAQSQHAAAVSSLVRLETF